MIGDCKRFTLKKKGLIKSVKYNLFSFARLFILDRGFHFEILEFGAGVLASYSDII